MSCAITKGAADKAARLAQLEKSIQRRKAEIRRRPGIFEALRQVRTVACTLCDWSGWGYVMSRARLPSYSTVGELLSIIVHRTFHSSHTSLVWGLHVKPGRYVASYYRRWSCWREPSPPDPPPPPFPSLLSSFSAKLSSKAGRGNECRGILEFFFIVCLTSASRTCFGFLLHALRD